MKLALRGTDHQSYCALEPGLKAEQETLRPSGETSVSVVHTGALGDSDTFLTPKSFSLVCKQSPDTASLCVPTPPPTPITTGKEEWLRWTKHNADGSRDPGRSSLVPGNPDVVG